jgi:hypothetical protein
MKTLVVACKSYFKYIWYHQLTIGRSTHNKCVGYILHVKTLQIEP